MICDCGSDTVTRKVTRDKAPIAEYEECRACGRICWSYGQEELKAHDSISKSDGAIKSFD